MAGYFYGHVLDELIAPGATRFTTADIPDMSLVYDQQRYWLSNFFLNSVLRARFDSALMAYATAFLRRAEGAFAMHNLARTATNTLLSLPQVRPSEYSTALLHWEGHLSQAAQAQNVLKQVIRTTSDPAFMIYQPGDGSTDQRLHSIYNSLKHVEKRISTPGQNLDNSVSPVWMTNEGIRSTEHTLTWTETGTILEEIGDFADGLQDPGTFAQQTAPRPPSP